MKFKPEQKVVSVGGMKGEILHHVRGSDGGSYRVAWENGHTSLIAPCNIKPLDVPDTRDQTFSRFRTTDKAAKPKQVGFVDLKRRTTPSGKYHGRGGRTSVIVDRKSNTRLNETFSCLADAKYWATQYNRYVGERGRYYGMTFTSYNTQPNAQPVESKNIDQLTAIVRAACAFVDAIDTDKQIDAVSRQAPDEWAQLADAVIINRGAVRNRSSR